MATELSFDAVWDVAHYLLGTCNSAANAIDHFELEADQDELEDRLLDINVELCKGCNWWHESCMLICDDGGNALCEQCAPELHANE